MFLHLELLPHGLELIRSLPQVMPDQVSGRIQAIYHDAQQSLRIPFVNLTFRILANYPDYLESAWGYVGPLARTQRFERAADELRTVALLKPPCAKTEVDWEQLGDVASARSFTNTIHYVLPKLLLISTLLERVMTGAASAPTLTVIDARGPELPLGPADGTLGLTMVDLASATEPVRRLLAEIKDHHVHPEVASFFRVLAQWPELLQVLWQELKPAVGSAVYKQRSQVLLERATSCAVALELFGDPSEHRTFVGRLEPSDFRDLHALLRGFRAGLDPDLLIDATLVRAILEGRENASRSPFSITALQ